MPHFNHAAASRSRTEGRTFLVGQDSAGHWVAVDATGRAGGLFRSRHDAIRFASVEIGCAPEAVPVSSRTLAVPL